MYRSDRPPSTQIQDYPGATIICVKWHGMAWKWHGFLLYCIVSCRVLMLYCVVLCCVVLCTTVCFKATSSLKVILLLLFPLKNSSRRRNRANSWAERSKSGVERHRKTSYSYLWIRARRDFCCKGKRSASDRRQVQGHTPEDQRALSRRW